MLKLTDITKSFTTPDGPPVEVLRGVSLEVGSGDSVAICGPSGCGKSTLLNIIGALDRPTSGSITFEGRDLASLSDRDLAALRSREIGFIFQLHHLLPQCTVLENVLVPVLAAGQDLSGAEQRARDLLARVGLEQRMNSMPAGLSGGERQRVAVVRALINSPRLVLADEPTGSLDQEAAAQLGQLLVDLNQDAGTTLIVVTHAQSLSRLMNRQHDLREGRLSPAKT